MQTCRMFADVCSVTNKLSLTFSKLNPAHGHAPDPWKWVFTCIPYSIPVREYEWSFFALQWHSGIMKVCQSQIKSMATSSGLFCANGYKRSSHCFTPPRTSSGQACSNRNIFEPFWEWKKTPRGKPPGWKTSRESNPDCSGERGTCYHGIQIWPISPPPHPPLE